MKKTRLGLFLWVEFFNMFGYKRNSILQRARAGIVFSFSYF